MPHLYKKRYVTLPTLWGWGVIMVGLMLVLAVCLKNLYGFLALHQPIQASTLVVEGWVPDYALEQSAQIFFAGQYDTLISTGTPLAVGFYLARYKTYPDLAKASLEKMGVPDAALVSLPTRKAMRDRTYKSALVLAQWLRDRPDIQTVNVVTLGPHARRTYFLFRSALPETVRLGVISIPSEDYLPSHWWKSSSGVRTVLSEAIAYLYSRFLWVPDSPAEGLSALSGKPLT